MTRPTDAQWQAIEQNDVRANGQFWYAVRSTGIFCRPACPSRLPKRENVVIYATPGAAQAAGYRPCKRCRPLAAPVANSTWVAEINHVLTTQYATKLTLTELADQVHGSPSYLRHVYQHLTGQTPQQRLQEIRLDHARELLRTTDWSVGDIATAVGFTSPAYFTRCFRQSTGQRPSQYRQERFS